MLATKTPMHLRERLMTLNEDRKSWEGNGWTQYQKLVLAELERLSESQKSVLDEVSKLKVEIAMLQVKSGVWGILGGLIPVLILILLDSLRK